MYRHIPHRVYSIGIPDKYKDMKINGHTVRGGWSKKFWDVYVEGERFTLFSETGSEIPQSKMRWWKKHIEKNGIKPTAPFTMLMVTSDGQLVGAK